MNSKLRMALLITVLAMPGFIFAQTKKDNDYLLLVRKNSGAVGYKNKAGKMVIPFGKYEAAFTDTLRNYGVVVNSKSEFIGIDKNQKVLFKVYPFDNGPDELSDGLFRIIENGKIGFADAFGKIIIKPKYPCAFTFQNGLAKVSLSCTSKSDGEHTEWKSENWIYIDKSGRVVK